MGKDEEKLVLLIKDQGVDEKEVDEEKEGGGPRGGSRNFYKIWLFRKHFLFNLSERKSADEWLPSIKEDQSLTSSLIHFLIKGLEFGAWKWKVKSSPNTAINFY